MPGEPRAQLKQAMASAEWHLFQAYIEKLIAVPELEIIYVVTGAPDRAKQVLMNGNDGLQQGERLRVLDAREGWAAPGGEVNADPGCEANAVLKSPERSGQAPEDFHLGRVLKRLVDQAGITHLLVSGGTALPLLASATLRSYVRRLCSMERGLITNNPQSGDLVMFHPATAIHEIQLPRSDNALSNNLQYQANLPRELMAQSTETLFDIDTPTDLLLYHRLTGEPTWLLTAYGPLFDRASKKLEALLPVIGRDYRELILAGRVAGNIISYINTHLRVRLRIFAEERGMKALGRIDRGEVSSFLGLLAEQHGVDALFSYFESVGEAMLWDNRAPLYHMGRGLPGHSSGEADWDRFMMDLFYPEAVKDPVLQTIADRAWESDMPMLLGGHSLVSGGIYALVELVYRQGGPEI